MKKLMWVLAMITVIVTSIVFQFIPDRIPMHYDLAGNIDRWGNKWESFNFPMIILIVTLFWSLFIRYFEKKELNGKTEKECMEAKVNKKILGVVGVCEVVVFSVMHFTSLYSSCIEAEIGSQKATLDIMRVLCVLLGIMDIVLGNFMNKTKNNSILGVRTTWSMYNDNTWRKSNRIGAIGLIIVGLLTIITTAFADGKTSIFLMLFYLVIATVVIIIYSKKVYNYEKI